MISLDVNTTEIDRFIQDIKSFVQALNNREELMQDIKSEQVERWNANVTSQGAEYSQWKPTSRSYQQQRVREGWQAQPTLDRSGKTILHVIRMNEDGTVTNNSAEWNFENNVAGRAGQYPVSHDQGYQLGSSTVPSRVIWELDEKDVDRGAREVDEWLGGVIATHLG